jgi:hypothetical protein
MSNEEDPFDAFGDSSDDDEEDVQMEENEATRIARSLVEQANEKLTISRTAASGENDKQNLTSNADPSSAEEPVDLSHLQPLQSPWPDPLYLGPMLLVSSLPVGGGRGYVASRNLEPGTLVLVEELIMTWPPEQLGQPLDMSSVQNLLEHPNALEIVKDMEDFHPSKADVDGDASDDDGYVNQISKMMRSLRSKYPEELLIEMVRLAGLHGIQNRDASSLTPTDILRLLIALRYNGLESGVYRNVAMLNHSCRPNCTKLLPSGEHSYSEVRTTRPVAAGESLTISYLPRVVSHASRRKHLWEQHRFDIGAHLAGDELKMELVGTSLPPSAIARWDDDAITHRIEQATEELESLHRDSASDINDGNAPPNLWEVVKALEVSSLELYTGSLEHLKNDRHVILIPILSLHLETCTLVQRAPSLPVFVHLGILYRIIASSIRLLALQEALLGPDHFDLGRTNLDLAQAIAELLSRSPKHLFDMDIPSLKTFDAWAALEHKSRKGHARIKALYPHDAEEVIQKGKI